MSNTLNPYPTDLNTPCRILLSRFGGTPAAAAEQVHACYQIVGVAAGNAFPDGPSPIPTADIWDRPDGMKSCPCPTPDQCKAALEEGCKMQGKIGDFFKSPTGQQLLQMALSLLPSLLAAL